MEEKALLRLSLLLSAAGLAGLYIISVNADFDSIPVEHISSEHIGRGVKVCGAVENKFTSRNNHTFFDLSDGTGGIRVVAFASSRIKIDRESVCVVGTVDLYEGELEVVAKSVIGDG